MAIDLPTRWNYWMWDEEGKYNYKYDHDMSDHPDYEHLERTGWTEEWTRRLFWTAEQAAALSFGRSPDQVPWDNNPYGVKEMDGESEFPTYFCELRRRILEAQNREILPKAIPALMYIQWADANRLPFPPALADAIQVFYDSLALRTDAEREKVDERSTEKKPRDENAELHPRRRNNYLKAILGMAKEKYRFPRAGVAKRISDDLAKHELELGEETILSFLKEAEDLA